MYSIFWILAYLLLQEDDFVGYFMKNLFLCKYLSWRCGMSLISQTDNLQTCNLQLYQL